VASAGALDLALMAFPSRLTFLALAGSLMMLAALATDIMLPAFPTMARDLQVSDTAVQQVLSIFLLGYAVPHLVIGSFADRFGRRPVLLAGLLVYGVGSVLCLLAPSFVWLLLGRFVQGLGAASGPILARAVLRDLYQGTELGRMLSFAMIVFAAGPILAPSIGAGILQFGDWHLMFIFLLVIAGVFLTWVGTSLPETVHRRDEHALNPRQFVRNARLILLHPQSGWAVLMLALSQGALIGYLTSAPFLFLEFFGVSERAFALLFAAVAAASFVTQPLNATLLKRYSAAQILQVVLPLFVLVSALLLVQVSLDGVTLTRFTINLSLFFACFTLVAANGTAIILEPHRERAGIASGLMGFTQLFLGTVIGTFIGSFAGYGPLPFALSITVLTLLVLPVFAQVRRHAQPARVVAPAIAGSK
jgi:DHA1 family bicyclomycin/chloramphenicol resistance-like MFS transporter